MLIVNPLKRLIKAQSFGKLLKRSPVLPEDSGGNKVQLLILGHLDLRLSIQIYYKQLRLIILENHNMAFFLCTLATLEKFWFASVAETIAEVSIVIFLALSVYSPYIIINSRIKSTYFYLEAY